MGVHIYTTQFIFCSSVQVRGWGGGGVNWVHAYPLIFKMKNTNSNDSAVRFHSFIF